MIFGSVCSGIEAASVAWQPLGWRPAFYAEIEPFPAAVLVHRHGSGRALRMPSPDADGIDARERRRRIAAIKSMARLPEIGTGAPNLGDFTQIQDGDHEPIDVLIGGTPCQSFSLAGLREGLADQRGNLALEYLRLAQRLRPRWLAWENVPGVLSSNDGRDFGSILGGMVQLGYGIAYRVLDAQYIRVDGYARAVPQRRRRVIAVGYLGDWRRAAAVLFERACLSGNPPPRREAFARIAGGIAPGAPSGFGLGTESIAAQALTANGVGTCGADDNQAQAGHLIAFGGNNTQGAIDVATALRAKGGTGHGDFESETFIASSVAPSLTAGGAPFARTGNERVEAEALVAHTLRADGFDASEDGSGRGTPLVPLAFTSKDWGADVSDTVSPTLRAMNYTGSHANAGGQIAVAFDMRGREGGAMMEGPHDTASVRAASGGSSRSYLATRYAVRRLIPRECERLQGFPDDFTLVPWRGRDVCPDGPRYKALGNSMAVNVIRWLSMRIDMVDRLEVMP